ncbi:MAG: hypothetical protein DRI34_12190 [Deltaproteobacteria bacterium]|nr:MAG: hypothetical protein DRI34_12190 [Deltaproteobacteria bacterium]
MLQHRAIWVARLSLSLALVLGALGPGCGGGTGRMELALQFSPRDLPAGTTSVRYYVLPTTLSDNSQAVCEDFLGPDAPKSVLDYGSDMVVSSETPVTDTTTITIVVENLPPGSFMFYLEAMASSSVAGCGCGSGSISAGEKTVIPIRLVQECRI